MRFLILSRSVGLKKKPKKQNHKKSRNRRPWYPRTTLKVNIHIFGLTKCTIYCKKCSCLCSCFSLCCYYAHFAAILITFCVNITFCGDYYILRRNTQSSAGSRLSDLRVNLWLRRCGVCRAYLRTKQNGGCAEIIVHRMFAVLLNGLNGKSSSKSIVQNILFSVYLF